MSDAALKPRPLGRTRHLIAPILWDAAALGARPQRFESVLQCLCGLGATWMLLPAEMSEPSLARLGDGLRMMRGGEAHLVLSVTVEELALRRRRVVEERLAALGRGRCDAVLLRDAATSEIKAGGPFHRLAQLRDRGVTEHFFVEARDHEMAEWLLHHSPAHAISIPFCLREQTAKYRLLKDAIGYRTGIIARVAESPSWPLDDPIDVRRDIAFMAGEEGVLSVLLPLPESKAELMMVVEAVNQPLANEERREWWERFARDVPEPAAPARSGPPEFGA